MSQNHIMRVSKPFSNIWAFFSCFQDQFLMAIYQLSTIVAVMKRQHVSVRDNFLETNFRQSCARPVYHVENRQIQCCQHWWGQSLTRIVLTGSFLCNQTFSKAEAKSWSSYWFILSPLFFMCRIPQFWKITTGSRQWACSERPGCSPTCQLRTGRPDTDTTLTSFIWSHHGGPVCFFFLNQIKTSSLTPQPEHGEGSGLLDPGHGHQQTERLPVEVPHPPGPGQPVPKQLQPPPLHPAGWPPPWSWWDHRLAWWHSLIVCVLFCFFSSIAALLRWLSSVQTSATPAGRGSWANTGARKCARSSSNKVSLPTL